MFEIIDPYASEVQKRGTKAFLKAKKKLKSKTSKNPTIKKLKKKVLKAKESETGKRFGMFLKL